MRRSRCALCCGKSGPIAAHRGKGAGFPRAMRRLRVFLGPPLGPRRTGAWREGLRFKRARPVCGSACSARLKFCLQLGRCAFSGQPGRLARRGRSFGVARAGAEEPGGRTAVTRPHWSPRAHQKVIRGEAAALAARQRLASRVGYRLLARRPSAVSARQRPIEDDEARRPARACRLGATSAPASDAARSRSNLYRTL